MTPSSVKMAMSIPFAALLFGSPKQVAHALAMSKIEKNANTVWGPRVVPKNAKNTVRGPWGKKRCLGSRAVTKIAKEC